MAWALPRVTVVIRSYNRIPAMLELVRACQAQDASDFEILVVEQSAGTRESYRAEFAALREDPRVRILEYPPLGPAGARNEALREARGEVLLFMDDDDLPVGTGWVRAHARHYLDPACIGVSGRQVNRPDEDPSPHNTPANRRLCLKWTALRMPRARVRHTMPLRGVDLVTGGNGSFRREALLRAGGWDDHECGEEYSILFRLERVRQPGEYYAYEPEAVMLRRLDLAGGSERRFSPPARVLGEHLGYSHLVIRRYAPVRFYACYPVYLWLALKRSEVHLRELEPGAPAWPRWAALLRAFPGALRAVWRRVRQQPAEAAITASGARRPEAEVRTAAGTP